MKEETISKLETILRNNSIDAELKSMQIAYAVMLDLESDDSIPSGNKKSFAVVKNILSGRITDTVISGRGVKPGGANRTVSRFPTVHDIASKEEAEEMITKHDYKTLSDKINAAYEEGITFFFARVGTDEAIVDAATIRSFVNQFSTLLDNVKHTRVKMPSKEDIAKHDPMDTHYPYPVPLLTEFTVAYDRCNLKDTDGENGRFVIRFSMGCEAEMHEVPTISILEVLEKRKNLDRYGYIARR